MNINLYETRIFFSVTKAFSLFYHGYSGVHISRRRSSFTEVQGRDSSWPPGGGGAPGLRHCPVWLSWWEVPSPAPPPACPPRPGSQGPPPGVPEDHWALPPGPGTAERPHRGKRWGGRRTPVPGSRCAYSGLGGLDTPGHAHCSLRVWLESPAHPRPQLLAKRPGYCALGSALGRGWGGD